MNGTSQRSICRMGGVLAGLCIFAERVAAQAPGAAPTTTVTSGRSLTFEWVLTVVMCGVALYVVCRSSHRN